MQAQPHPSSALRTPGGLCAPVWKAQPEETGTPAAGEPARPTLPVRCAEGTLSCAECQHRLGGVPDSLRPQFDF